MATFLAGTKLRLKETFTDSTGALIDPGTVSVKYGIPPAVATTKAYPADIIRDSLGVYHYDLDTTGMSGGLVVEWITTGVGQAAEVHVHYIRALPI